MPSVDVIRIYPVEAEEPCHLVEVAVRGADRPIALERFTQAQEGVAEEDWQVPWDERVLDARGETVVADWETLDARPETLSGDVRLIFLFHYLDLDRPLLTPYGAVPLPKETGLPERLSAIEYEPP